MKLSKLKNKVALSVLLSLMCVMPSFAETVNESVPVGVSISNEDIGSFVAIEKFETIKSTIAVDLFGSDSSTNDVSDNSKENNSINSISIDSNFSDGKIDGVLKNGVSVVAYRADDSEINRGSFKPSRDKLISDAKFTISSEDGSFSIPVDTKNMNIDTKVILSISYPVKSGSSSAVKTFYVSIPYLDIKKYENLRISGNDRFDTNIESVKASFKDGANTAIITSGYNFADPLVAGPLAIKLNAPIIFSGYQGLEQKQIDLIKSLGVKNIVVVGGDDYVPEGIRDQIKGIEKFTRISGSDRYETAKKLLDYYGNSDKIIISNGKKFQDALSATPLSKKINAPIMIVGNKMDNLDISKYKSVTIVGGENSVSKDIESKIKLANSNIKVERVAGNDRSQTSLKSAEIVGANKVMLVNKDKFADALSGINIIVKDDLGLLLVGKDSVGRDIEKFISDKEVHIVGGENSISKSIMKY